MSIDKALELIKKYNACNNEKPIECCNKKCEECEHKYDEKEWYQMFNQLAQWLEELKAIKDLLNSNVSQIYFRKKLEEIVNEIN